MEFEFPELNKEYILEVFVNIKHSEDDDYLHIGKDKIIILELDNKNDLTNDYLKEILELNDDFKISFKIKDIKENYIKAKEIAELIKKNYYDKNLDNEFSKVNGGMFQIYEIYSLENKELNFDMS